MVPVATFVLCSMVPSVGVCTRQPCQGTLIRRGMGKGVAAVLRGYQDSFCQLLVPFIALLYGYDYRGTQDNPWTGFKKTGVYVSDLCFLVLLRFLNR